MRNMSEQERAAWWAAATADEHRWFDHGEGCTRERWQFVATYRAPRMSEALRRLEWLDNFAVGRHLISALRFGGHAVVDLSLWFAAKPDEDDWRCACGHLLEWDEDECASCRLRGEIEGGDNG